MIIYYFKCTCGATYAGRTTRQLSKRIKEHNPSWLRHGGKGTISTSIVTRGGKWSHSICPLQLFAEFHNTSQKQLGFGYCQRQKQLSFICSSSKIPGWKPVLPCRRIEIKQANWHIDIIKLSNRFFADRSWFTYGPHLFSIYSDWNQSLKVLVLLPNSS